MRQLPDSFDDFKLGNDISFLGFNLFISNYFDLSMLKITQITKKLKRSLYPQGALALSKFSDLLPTVICQYVKKWALSKGTLILSNIPGPKVPY